MERLHGQGPRFELCFESDRNVTPTSIGTKKDLVARRMQGINPWEWPREQLGLLCSLPLPTGQLFHSNRRPTSSPRQEAPNPPDFLKEKSTFFFFFNLLIYLFLAVLGLRFCARAFSSCGERGPLFIAVHGPLTVVASPVAEHRLQTRRLSGCGSRA